MALGPTSLGSSQQKTANQLFGGAGDLFGGGNANSIFASEDTGLARQSLRLSIKGLERERSRLLGFKTDLTPAQNKRLSELQKQITDIEAKAGDIKGLTIEELQERAELYQESYRIMGKDFVDKDADPRLQDLTEQVDALLAPKLRGPAKVRLERLQKLENDALDALVANPEGETARRRLRNIKRQISELTQPRDVSRLSVAERRDYDELVGRINDIARSEFLPPSRTKMRIEQLTTSINQLKAQEAAFGDDQLTPTPAQVARAYSR